MTATIKVYFTGELSPGTVKSIAKSFLSEAHNIERKALDSDLEPFGDTIPDIDELRRVAKQLTDILRSEGKLIGGNG